MRSPYTAIWANSALHMIAIVVTHDLLDKNVDVIRKVALVTVAE